MSTITLNPTHAGPERPAPVTVRATVWSGDHAAPPARTLVRPNGDVRLTRRGRLAVFLACVAVVFGIAFFLGASSVATQEPGVAESTEVVTVGTGETLWELAAERTDAGGDVREMMLRIERLNALESAALDAGQRLLVPTG